VITIRIDWQRRLFTLCGDGQAVVSFKRYGAARSLWLDLQAVHS
jgi:hypothetical protein